MRIAYIAPFDLSLPAGHSEHVLASVQEMVEQGNNVTLFALGCPPELARRVRFVRVPALRTAGLLSVSFGLGVTVALAVDQVRHRHELVYTRYFKAVAPVMAVAKLTAEVLILELNASFENERKHVGNGERAQFAQQLEERAVLYLADGIVTVARGIEREVRRRHPKLERALLVVENGVDTELYRPLDQAGCRLKLGLRAAQKYVVFAGSLQTWQGATDFIDAVHRAVEAGVNVHAILVGDGPERVAVETLVAKLGLGAQVTITGYRSAAEVAQYLSAADVCVAPYNTKAAEDAEPDKIRYGASMRGSPLKIMTYLACGRPVIATHFAEAGAYLERNMAGVAVPPEDPQALATAMIALLADRRSAELLGAAGRNLAVNHHTWASAVARCLAFAGQLKGKRTRWTMAT